MFSVSRRSVLKMLLAGSAMLPLSLVLDKRVLASGSRPTLIFRLDDAEAGDDEQVVAAIIEVFRARGLKLDVGVVPFNGGSESFAMPFLRDYAQRGDVNISIHGLRHFFGEFRLRRQGSTKAAETTADLARLRREVANYYGLEPVAFTVPYDRYDRLGYDAVQKAGFRILSSQWRSELHPSDRPVDYDGHPDPHGLIRLPTIRDVTVWEGGKGWGNVVDVDHLLESVRRSLSGLDVAVLGLHPEAFAEEGSDGKPNEAKLARLDHVLAGLTANLAVTTFAGWYATQQRAQ